MQGPDDPYSSRPLLKGLLFATGIMISFILFVVSITCFVIGLSQ